MHRRARRRIVTVVLAPVAALIGWLLVRLIGVDLVVSGPGSKTLVHASDVFGAALVSALVGWVVLRLIERYSSRPRRVWGAVASMGLALSVVLGPSWLADGSSAVALIGLHIVTAAVVIGGFVGTLPAPAKPVAHPGRRCRTPIRHDDRMIELDGIAGRRWTVRLARMRAGQVLGLLFLIGPLADLAGGHRPPARVAAIGMVVVAFALVYVLLLPPIPLLSRHGLRAVAASLALLAAVRR